MAEDLGVAQLRLEVDTSELSRGLEAARRQIQDFNAEIDLGVNDRSTSSRSRRSRAAAPAVEDFAPNVSRQQVRQFNLRGSIAAVESIAEDIGQIRSARNIGISSSWNRFLEQLTEITTDLSQIGAAKSLNLSSRWTQALTSIREISDDLQLIKGGERLNIRASWQQTLASLSQVQEDLALVSGGQRVNLGASWTAALSALGEVRDDIALVSSGQRLNLSASWTAALASLGEIKDDIAFVATGERLNLSSSWATALATLGEVKDDIAFIATGERLNISASWSAALATFAEFSEDLRQIKGAERLNLRATWTAALAALAEVETELKAIAAGDRLNLRNTWNAALQSLQEVKNDIALIESGKQVNLNTSWSNALSALNEIDTDLELIGQGKKLNLRTSWIKALGFLNETTNVIQESNRTDKAKALGGSGTGTNKLSAQEAQAIARVLDEISRVDASKPFDDLAASSEQATRQLAATKAELASLLSGLPSPANPVEELGDSGKSAVAELSSGFNALQSEIDQTSSKVERLKKLQDSLRQSGAATPTAAPNQRASSIPESASRPITTKTSQSRIEGAARSLLEWTDGVLPGVENLFGSLEKALDVIRAKGAIFDPDAVPGLDADTARNDRAIGRQTPATEAVSAAYREFYASVEKEAAKPRKVINIDLDDLNGKLAQARQQVRSTLESIAKDRAGAPVGTTAGISPQTLGSVQSTKASIDQVLGAINRVKQQIASIKAVDLTPSGAEELNQFNGILDSIDSQFKTLRGTVEQSGDAISNLQAPVDATSSALAQLDIAPDVQSKITALTEQIRLLEVAAEGAGAAVKEVGGGAAAPPPPPPPPRPRASLSDLGIARQDAQRRQAAAPVGSTANVKATQDLARIEALITREKQRQEQLNKRLGISSQGQVKAANDKLNALSAETKASRSAADRRGKKVKDAVGSAIIGGAFPALFGQGLGASVGGGLGGLGGGAIGGQFGFGLSLVGTALGAQVDAAVAKLGVLGNALKDPVANFQELAQAGLVSSSALEKNIAALIANGKEAEASALIRLDAARQFGDTAEIEALASANDELKRSFAQLSVLLVKVAAGPLANFANVLASTFRGFSEKSLVDERVRQGGLNERERTSIVAQARNNTAPDRQGLSNAEGAVILYAEVNRLLDLRLGKTKEVVQAEALIAKAIERSTKLRSNSFRAIDAQVFGNKALTLELEKQSIELERQQQIAAKPDIKPEERRAIDEKASLDTYRINQDIAKLDRERYANNIVSANKLRDIQAEIAIQSAKPGLSSLGEGALQALRQLEQARQNVAEAQAKAAVTPGDQGLAAESVIASKQLELAGVSVRNNLREAFKNAKQAVQDLSRSLEDSQLRQSELRGGTGGVNQFLGGQALLNRQTAEFQNLLPKFNAVREQLARSQRDPFAAQGIRNTNFSGATADVNRSLTEFIRSAREELRVEQDQKVIESQLRIAESNQKLITSLTTTAEQNTSLAVNVNTLREAVTALTGKDWSVVVNVTNETPAVPVYS